MKRLGRIDWLLFSAAGVAVAMLLISLAWPAIEAWWHRPIPGKQIAQQFFGTVLPVQDDPRRNSLSTLFVSANWLGCYGLSASNSHIKRQKKYVTEIQFIG